MRPPRPGYLSTSDAPTDRAPAGGRWRPRRQTGQSRAVNETGMQIRPALPADVRAIKRLVEPYARRRILLGKDLVDYYESVQEFLVAEAEGELVGCGALHVMWEDLGE